MKTIKELYFILYNNFHLLENRPHLYEVEDEKIEDEGLCDLRSAEEKKIESTYF